ncbi:hypothetical protein Ahu01nite_025570 [Winogradskya humida]|uniref:Uncharacterized protein n=1 Tax=Winogradskya humida TaxID=113566 RepID=A0ABQ3ZLI6_9ACTN|nr:hypothetical protein Ahu01nite_025570 [Actinoplanes humidus]
MVGAQKRAAERAQIDLGIHGGSDGKCPSGTAGSPAHLADMSAGRERISEERTLLCNPGGSMRGTVRLTARHATSMSHEE